MRTALKDSYVDENSFLLRKLESDTQKNRKTSLLNYKSSKNNKLFHENRLRHESDSVIELKPVLISSIDDFRLLREQWNELYESCQRSTLFSSWEWMFSWWEIFRTQGQRQLFIICFYYFDKLVGIAPFQIEKTFPQYIIQGKTLSFIGLGELRDDRIVSQYLDLVVAPGFETDVVKAVSEYLTAHKKDWSFADFEYLLKDALILQCFDTEQAAITRQKTEYGVRFSISNISDFEAYTQKMSRRWRKTYAKKNRLLERDGEVSIESMSSLDDIDPVLEQLAEMHCSRWRKKVDHCVFDSKKFMAFHRKVIERLLPLNKTSIKTLTLNGEPLASYYIFSDKGQVHYYQSGFYAKFANRYSPLFLLVCKEIGAAVEKNRTFDFMYTDSPDSYKRTQYAADYESMYRLRWSTQAFRIFVFRCAKALQLKILNYYCGVKTVVKNIWNNN